MHLTSDRWLQVREFVGLGALLVFAFFAWLGTGVAHAALAMMILLPVADFRAVRDVLSRDPMTRVFAFFLAYLLFSAFQAAHQWPETARAQWASVWPWTSLWLFLPVAWWLKGSWSRVWAIMILAPLGLIAGILRRSTWADFPRWLDGQRYEFGYTALGISLLSLIVMIGLLNFFPRLRLLGETRLSRACIVLSVFLLQLFFLFILLVAQSRGAWLSLVFAILLLGSLAAFQLRLEPRGSRSHAFRWLSGLVLAAGVLLAAITQFGARFVERVRSEADLIPQLFSLPEEQLPYTPWGARIHLSLWGLRLIAERPWLGWGPGANAPRHLLKLEFGGQESGFLTVIEHFVHLHNAYLEVLMRFGLVGGSIFACGMIIFLKNLRIQRREGIFPSDFYIFGLVVLFTILFFAFYEFRLLHTDFRFLAMLVGGIFHTFALHPAARSAEPEPAGCVGTTR